mgnify:CR=1 FL=1
MIKIGVIADDFTGATDLAALRHICAAHRGLGTAAILAAFGASAQTFPAAGKSITIVVPFAAGGPTDKVARDLAEAIRKPLGGQVITLGRGRGYLNILDPGEATEAAARGRS